MASPVITPQISAPATFPEKLPGSPVVDQKGLVTWIWLNWFRSLPLNVKTQQLVKGTHAVRLSLPASQYANGSKFYETDRRLWYVSIGNAWVYESGIIQAAHPTIPVDLGPNDTGLLFYMADFAHLLMWNGMGWQWGPGDAGSDQIVAFLSGPSPVTGWQACDGSTVQKLNSDGSIVTVTVPSTPGIWYRL